MILHGIDARDVDDDDRILGNAELAAHALARGRIGAEFFAVDAVVDHRELPGAKAMVAVKCHAGLRIGDDELGQSRQPRAQPNDPAVAARIHVGGAQIPEQLALAPAGTEVMRKARRDIAVIHPALQDARPQAVHAARQRGNGRRRGRQRARIQHRHIDAGRAQIGGKRVMRAQAHHVLRQAARPQAAGKLHQHRLRPAHAQPGYDMQHVGHGGPTTRASCVNKAASS